MSLLWRVQLHDIFSRAIPEGKPNVDLKEKCVTLPAKELYYSCKLCQLCLEWYTGGKSWTGFRAPLGFTPLCFDKHIILCDPCHPLDYHFNPLSVAS